MQGGGGIATAGRKRAAVELVAHEDAELRRTARRFSLCEDDAEDAYQRALEILLVKAPSDRPRELIRWMKTVVKHEALAIRRYRERMLGVGGEGGDDPVARIASSGAGPGERLELGEQVARSREALQALKPAELRSLTLLAAGYSYVEIGEITGFSQTKVNRCLAEGRQRFRRLLTRSEDGSRCAELAPLLSAYCDGEASEEDEVAVREHLRACAACRTTMRAYRATPAAVAALAPALPVSRSLLERAQELLVGLHARLPGGGSDETGVTQIAAAGGTRGAGMAALAKALAICAGTVGGAAACVATGVAPVPFGIEPQHATPAKVERVSRRSVDESAQPPVVYEPASEPEPQQHPAPQPEPAPEPEPEPEPESSSPAPEASEAGAVEYAPPPGSPALTTTHYRIRDPQGTTIGESRLSWIGDGIGPLVVPAIPGAYSAEVWFEDADGEQGPAATVPLRFDDVRPAPIEPLPIVGWVGRTAFPLRVRLGRPSGSLPLSGIRGYAIAIDAAPGGSACVAADRCTDAETTLRDGVAGDELEVGTLPEGTSYLHAVAVSGSGMKSAIPGQAVLRVDTTDPIVQLTGLPPGWTNRAVRLTASAADTGSGMERDGQGPAPFTAIRVDGGAPSIGLGGAVTAGVVEEGVHRVAYYARDLAGNVNDGAETNGIANRAPRIASVRIDRTPPSIAFANAEDPRDPELLRVRVSDRLAGPDPSRGSIGVRQAGSGDRFETLPAVAGGGGELRARWDSDAFPAGNYEFRALGYDAAGNVAATTRRQNGAPMVLSNPLKATTTLRVGFRRHGFLRTVPYGRRVLLRGRLITGRSSPLGGVPVRVVERFAPGAHPAVRASTVATGPNGAFSIRTDPGPSRTIAIGFDGSPTLARTAARSLQLGVLGRVRLRASAGVAEVGGAPLVFRGRLVAAPGEIPAEGRSIELQFRLPGLPWAEFRTVQTDGRGRFRYAYRFSDDDSRGAHFQFRAYAPAQEGWPYEPGGSRPVLVQGR